MRVGIIIEPRNEISNKAACATSKGSDQPVHTRSLILVITSQNASLLEITVVAQLLLQ